MGIMVDYSESAATKDLGLAELGVLEAKSTPASTALEEFHAITSNEFILFVRHANLFPVEIQDVFRQEYGAKSDLFR